MRKLYWYLTAYAKKHGVVFLASIIGAIAVFSFTIPSLISTFENKQTFYVGLVGSYTFDTLPDEVTKKLSAGLTKIQDDGSIDPVLAQRWNSEEDGKTYRFILKDNLFFKDGTQLTTQDVNYNFPNVESIISPNDIVFKLQDPFAPFPVAVAQPILKKQTVRYKFFLNRPIWIGVGPYEMKDYHKHNNRITQVTIESKADKYVYKFYLTEKDAVTAFKHGEIDYLPYLSQEYDIGAWSTTKVIKTIDYNKYLAVFFDLRNPKFTKNIRQALSYSIEKPNDESRALGPISPNSWAYLSAVKTYDKDMDRAVERLLDEPPQEKIEFTLTTTSTYLEYAEKIISEWKELGERANKECQSSQKISNKSSCEFLNIEVSLKISNFPDTSNFEALLFGQESPPDPDQYGLWHSDQSTNFTGYTNLRIDSKLETGRQTTNFQERKEIYQEFQQFFLEDAPAIFIKHLDSYTIER